MNPYLVDPVEPRKASEYTGTYHNDDGTVLCHVRAVRADDGEILDREFNSRGVQIDPAAVERDLIAYFSSFDSAALRSMQIGGAPASGRPLEVITAETRGLPARPRPGLISRIKGLLGKG